MEKMSILTQTQKLIFDQVSRSHFFRSNFYFTGGTALSEFYLKHRYSEDLDFFSEKKFDLDLVREEVEKWAKKLGFTFEAQFREVVYIFIFKFNDDSILKVDFGYYPHRRIEKGLIYKKLTIDSFIDLAVNKLSAVNQRSTVKDFVDLYFLLDKFTIWDLIEGVRVKFNMELEHWILGSDLAYVVEQFDTLPRMIKPLTLDELKKFYRQKAKELAMKRVEP